MPRLSGFYFSRQSGVKRAGGEIPILFPASGELAATRHDAPTQSTNEGSTRIVPIIVFHGDRDTTVHPRNGARLLATRRGAGVRRVYLHLLHPHHDAGDHAIA
jgi:hypothetical protein